MRVLSLGAGVQSSTLALMIAKGKVPMVDCAIFADTQWEPKGVYAWLDWLETQLPFPVHRVTQGSIRDAILTKQNSTGQRFAAVPWFITNPNGTHGMGRRQCTHEYKLKPLRRKMRELLGAKKGARIFGKPMTVLIGISVDEAYRMKRATDKWAVNEWPLIDLRMSRQDCLNWMRDNGYPTPAKSSCLGCPFHSDEQWREIKADPDAWADVLAIDEIIREPARGMRGTQYMHADRKPLAQIDLLSPRERGQTDLFLNECEGMCGV